MDLTLCLIIKNEEQHLAACLESFRGLYQKIVIADTGSTDKSREIARSYGAEVYGFTWCDDFAAARNFALDKVKSELVMVVDADDRIESSVKEKLIRSVHEMRPEVHGFFLPYIYSTRAKGQKGPSTSLPRIWRTRFGYRYTLPIHEYLDIPRKDLPSFEWLKDEIIHHKDTADVSKSLERNLTILRKAVQKNPNQRRILFYLGHDNHYAGHFEDAVRWYGRYADSPETNTHELNKVYTGKGLCHLYLEQREKAKECFHKAIEADRDFVDPYLHLGDMMMEEHKYDEAAQYYFEAIGRVPPFTHVFVNTRLYGEASRKKLEQALKQIEKENVQNTD